MGFVTKMKRWEAVPGEDAEFEMRPLSGAELQLAEDAGTSRGMDALKALSSVDPQVLKEWQAVGSTEEDPLRGLDTATVLKYGLVGWRGPDYADVPCDDEHKAELDAGTCDWTARWIAERSRRPLGEGTGSVPPSERAPSPQS